MSMSDVQATFGGVWKHVRSENLDEYLKARGIEDAVARKAVAEAYCTMTIKVDGGVGMIKMESTYVFEYTFVLGQFEISDPHAKGKAFASCKNGKLSITVYTDIGEEVVEREIVDGELLQTMYLRGVVSKRFFKKIG